MEPDEDGVSIDSTVRTYYTIQLISLLEFRCVCIMIQIIHWITYRQYKTSHRELRPAELVDQTKGHHLKLEVRFIQSSFFILGCTLLFDFGLFLFCFYCFVLLYFATV